MNGPMYLYHHFRHCSNWVLLVVSQLWCVCGCRDCVVLVSPCFVVEARGGRGTQVRHHLEKWLFTFNTFHTCQCIHRAWSLDISGSGGLSNHPSGIKSGCYSKWSYSTCSYWYSAIIVYWFKTYKSHIAYLHYVNWSMYSKGSVGVGCPSLVWIVLVTQPPLLVVRESENWAKTLGIWLMISSIKEMIRGSSSLSFNLHGNGQVLLKVETLLHYCYPKALPSPILQQQTTDSELRTALPCLWC